MKSGENRGICRRKYPKNVKNMSFYENRRQSGNSREEVSLFYPRPAPEIASGHLLIYLRALDKAFFARHLY